MFDAAGRVAQALDEVDGFLSLARSDGRGGDAVCGVGLRRGAVDLDGIVLGALAVGGALFGAGSGEDVVGLEKESEKEEVGEKC